MSSRAKESNAVIDFESPEYDAQFGEEQAKQHVGAPGSLEQRLEAAIEAACSSSSEVVQSRLEVMEQAVDWCLEAALKSIDMLFVARDGLPVSTTSLVQGSWDPEPAPVPCAADNWLRAAIPESQQPAQSFMLQEFLRNNTLTSRASGLRGSLAGSRRSTATSLPGGFGPGTPPKADKSSTRSHLSKPGKATKQQEPLPAAANPEQLEQKEAEQRLREELEVRRAQLQVAADMETKDAEARARLTTISKELRGREYCYNHKGEVVPLASGVASSSATASHLMHAGPAFAVKVAQDGHTSKPHGPTKRSPAKDHMSMQGTRPLGGIPGRGLSGTAAHQLTNDFKATAPRTQPNALEVMAPTGGVTLKSGNQSKIGPVRSQGARGMTLDELQRFAATVTGAATSSSLQRTAEGRSTVSGRSTGGSRRSPQRVGPGQNSSPTRTGTAGGASQLQSRLGSSATRATAPSRSSQQAAGSLDPLTSTAGPPHVFSEGRLSELPDSPNQATTGSTVRVPPLPVKLPALDASLGLVSAADWGHGSSTQGAGSVVHPALQTIKPTTRARELEVGRLARLPRDRAPQATMSPPLSPAQLVEAASIPRMTFATS